MNNKINNELEFEEYIRVMNDRDLLEFVARQGYTTADTCRKLCHDVYGNSEEGLKSRVEKAESKAKDNRKLIGIMATINGTLAITIVTFLLTSVMA